MEASIEDDDLGPEGTERGTKSRSADRVGPGSPQYL